MILALNTSFNASTNQVIKIKKISYMYLTKYYYFPHIKYSLPKNTLSTNFENLLYKTATIYVFIY